MDREYEDGRGSRPLDKAVRLAKTRVGSRGPDGFYPMLLQRFNQRVIVPIKPLDIQVSFVGHLEVDLHGSGLKVAGHETVAGFQDPIDIRRGR